MPDSEADGGRPIGRGVEGLHEEEQEAKTSLGALGDRLADDLAELRQLSDVPRRHVSPDELPDFGAASRKMRQVLGDLGSKVSSVVATAAGELDALRRPSPAGFGVPGSSTERTASRPPVEEGVAAVRAGLAGAHPEVAAVLARLVADTAHPLDLTRALADPRRRDVTLAVLAELADGRVLSGRTLEQYRAAHPGLRVKGPHAILEKVARMSTGREHRPARPGYRTGDVVDAVGARITVDGTAALAALTTTVLDRYGIGDGGRVLDMENRYTAPKPHNPAHRVMPFIIAVEVGGSAYTFELQLSTRRASVAADLEHNTVCKTYTAVTDHQRARVQAMQAEAAALDQDETRSEAR